MPEAKTKRKNHRSFKKIDAGKEECKIQFLNLNDSKKNIIRDTISSHLKSELNKYLLEHYKNINKLSEDSEDKKDALIENTNELNTHIDLRDFISPFTNNSDEHLYPILYQGFPSKEIINEKLDQISDNLITSFKSVGDTNFANIIHSLKLIFKQRLNTPKHDAYLYNLIYKHKKQFNKELEDARPIALLKSQIDSPFEHFFNLNSYNIDHLSFVEDSPEFDLIIREVCRNNIVTEKERLYLEEKAKEYFIDSEKLHRYLKNPFLGFETFKIFIDQICDDGVVTPIERDYIHEKAEEYNVPKTLLNKMISSGLLRFRFTSQLVKDDDFYEMVLIYLFANAFGLKTITQKFSSLMDFDTDLITDQLKTKKDILFDVL